MFLFRVFWRSTYCSRFPPGRYSLRMMGGIPVVQAPRNRTCINHRWGGSVLFLEGSSKS
jgi:hypothetical protein